MKIAATITAVAIAVSACGSTVLGEPNETTSTTSGAGGTQATTSTSTETTTTTSSTSTGSTSTVPPPPALGTQIDRFGRPIISTMLIGTFQSDLQAKGKLDDDYNADAIGSGAAHATEIAKSLAMVDGLDGVCGNQLLAAQGAPADRYAVFASMLAEDALFLYTGASLCAFYFAVEANATGLLANASCGGRRLDDDVIDFMYSALALNGISGVSDGIDPDADTAGKVFPYLAPPH